MKNEVFIVLLTNIFYCFIPNQDHPLIRNPQRCNLMKINTNQPISTNVAFYNMWKPGALLLVESVAMVARKVSTAGGAGFGAVGPATGAVGVAAKQSYCH